MSDPSRFSKRWLALPILGVLLLACLVSPWLLRNTIATSLARDALRERGVRCDDRFAVRVAPFFGSARVGPTRCTHEGGLIEAVELTGDATVELSGLEVRSLRAAGVRLTLRGGDVRNGSGWARELARLNLEQRVAALVKGLAELSDLGLPTTTIARLDVLRAGDSLGVAEQMVLTRATPTAVTLQRVSFDAVLGAARLTLSSVRGTATRSAVRLEGQATARAGIPLLGSFSTGGTFVLDATGLDAEPSFRLTGSF